MDAKRGADGVGDPTARPDNIEAALRTLIRDAALPREIAAAFDLSRDRTLENGKPV